MLLSFKKLLAMLLTLLLLLVPINSSSASATLQTPSNVSATQVHGVEGEIALLFGQVENADSYTAKVYDSTSVLVRTVDNFRSGGRISGLAVGETFSVTVTARSTSNNFLDSIESSPSVVTTSHFSISISTPGTELLGARSGTPFSLSLDVEGGVGDLEFSIDSGALPSGVTLNSSSGVIAGTPTAAGNFPIIVSVQDSVGNSSTTKAFRLVVVGSTANSIKWMGAGGLYAVENGSNAGTVVGQVQAIDVVSDSTISYSIVSGAGMAVSSETGIVTLTQTFSLTPGQFRTLEVAASNGINAPFTASFKVFSVDSAESSANGVLIEKWEGVGGATSSRRLETFVDSSEFTGAPSSTTSSAQIYLADSNDARGDYYGMRLSTYLVPPETGEYKFHLSSDDSSALYVGSSAALTDLPKFPQARIDKYSGSLVWNRDKEVDQTSGAIHLVRGQLYRVQVLFYQKEGIDPIALAWTTPGGAEPINGSTANLVPSSALYPISMLPDVTSPSAPKYFGLVSVDTNTVKLAWGSADSEEGVDHYLLSRNGTFIANIATASGVISYSDSVSTGTHTYSLVSVDAAGNQSAPTSVGPVSAGVTYDGLEQAMITGDASGIADETLVMDKILSEIANGGADQSTLLDAMYANAFTYEPGGSDGYWMPDGASDTLFPILTPNDGTSLSMAVAGKTLLGTPFAIFGTRPYEVASGSSTVDAGMSSNLVGLARWMVTGSSSTAPSGAKITLMEDSNYHSSFSNWVSAFDPNSSSGTLTFCTAANQACFDAMSTSDLIVVNIKQAESWGAEATLEALRFADQQGVPILLFGKNYGYGNADDVMAPGIRSYFHVTRDLAYWTRYKASTAAGDLATSKARTATFGAAPRAALARTIAHLKAEDWNVDLTNCSRINCDADPVAKAYVQQHFYDAAQAFLRSTLTSLSDDGTEIFGTSASAYRVLKLSVLLGDALRRTVKFPLYKTELPTFFRSYFADHVVYTLRESGEAQQDLGNFSQATPELAPRIQKSVSYEAREGDFMSSATVYAIPGEAVVIERLAGSALKVQISYTTLRDDNTHPYDMLDGYTRPKYMRSPWVTIEPGQSITMNSPRGGPLVVKLDKYVPQGSEAFPEVNLVFRNVTQHPVWDGDSTTAEFETILNEGLFGWAEILTPGFEVHSTRANLLESLTDPEFNTPAKLADGAYTDFYLSNYNLAGFVGPGLADSASVTALCSELGLSCQDKKYNRITSMNHYNSDQPTCGDGCSGNPYDAWWAFAPLGWGDAHEMGHNIQSLHITDLKNVKKTGEVSNNIFPTHTVAAWNRKNPKFYRTHSHELDQEALFALFASAARSDDPKAYVYDRLWKDRVSTQSPEIITTDGNIPVSFERDGVTSSRTLNQNTAQVMFYVTLVNYAQDLGLGGRTFGDAGWDVITLLHKFDRELRVNSKASTWDTWKQSHGFSLFSADDVKESRILALNDRLLISASMVMGLDMRPYFDMWGVYYSDLASQQMDANIAPFELETNVPKRLYYFPVDGVKSGKTYRYGMWGLQPIGYMPFATNMDQVPAVSMVSLITPDQTLNVTLRKPVLLRAWTSGQGSVKFSSQGVDLYGCTDVAAVLRDKSSYTSTETLVATDYEATCVWSPQTAGQVSVQVTYTPSSSETALPSGSGSVLSSTNPITWNFQVSESAGTPQITALSSSSDQVASTFTISGTGIDRVNGATANGTRLEVQPVQQGAIEVVVPLQVASSLVTGSFTLETTDGFRIDPLTFTPTISSPSSGNGNQVVSSGNSNPAPSSGSGGSGSSSGATNPSSSATVSGVPNLEPVSASRIIPGSVIQLRGSDLDKVSKVSIDGVQAEIIRQTSTDLEVRLPSSLSQGSKDVRIFYAGGERTIVGYLFIERADEASITPSQKDTKISVGSFKAFLVIYLKGYEGQRLSVRVGGRWMVIDSLKSNFERVLRKSKAGASVDISVYLDRKLKLTMTQRIR